MQAESIAVKVQEKTKRFDALDGLRAFAISIVLIAHMRGGYNFDTAVQRVFRVITDFGWVGVDLFFVLSGFLITGILLESKRKAHCASAYFKPFYGRRILRIFPLYYAYLLLVFCWIGPIAQRVRGDNPLSHDNPIWPILYLTNCLPMPKPLFPGLVHLWSLAVEEQFYLIWPCLVWVTRTNRLVWVCLSAFVLAPVMRWAFVVAGAEPFTTYRFTLCRVDTLCLGALLAISQRDAKLLAILDRWLPRLAIVSTAGVVAIVVWTQSALWTSKLMLIPGLTLTAVLSMWLVRECLTRWNHNSILVSKPARKLAQYSYGIYVLHPLFWIFLTRQLRRIFPGTMIGGTATFLCLALLSLAAAMLSWKFLEEPILRFKDRFSYGKA